MEAARLQTEDDKRGREASFDRASCATPRVPPPFGIVRSGLRGRGTLASFPDHHQPFRRASLAQGPEPVEGRLPREARRTISQGHLTLEFVAPSLIAPEAAVRDRALDLLEGSSLIRGVHPAPNELTTGT